MKTIQDCFREADKESLIRGYIYEHPFELKSDKEENFDSYKDFSLGEAYERFYNNVGKLIDHIREAELKKPVEDMIFFIHRCEKSGWDNIECSLVSIPEILDSSRKNNSYAYEFSSVEETAGYYVADTYLTNRHLYDVLISYLEEISFFGFSQERLEEEKSKLDEAIEDYENHKDDPNYFISEDDFFKHFEEKFGFEREKRDEVEETAWDKFIEEQIKYNKIAFDVELEKVITYLKEEGYSGGN